MSVLNTLKYYSSQLKEGRSMRLSLLWIFMVCAASTSSAEDHGKFVFSGERNTLMSDVNSRGTRKLITTMPLGSPLRIISEQGGLIEVELPCGLIGWTQTHTTLDADKAAAHFTSTIKQQFDPNDQVRVNLAKLTGGNLEEAEAKARKEYTNNKAQALAARGRVWTHKHEYDIALKDFNEAIQLDPSSPTHYEGRGDVWLRRQDYDKAISDFSESIRLGTPEGVDSAYIGRSRAWEKKGDEEKSLHDLREALRIQPRHRTVCFHPAALASSEEELRDNVIAKLGLLLKINPKDSDALRQRGVIWNLKGDFDRSVADLEQVCQLAPTDAGASNSYGVVLASKGDYGKAIAAFEDAIGKQPDYAGPVSGLAWLLATCPEPKWRDGKRAVELGKKACEMTKRKDAWCLNTLAAAYAEVGYYEAAVMTQQIAMDSAKGGIKTLYSIHLDVYERKEPYRCKPGAIWEVTAETKKPQIGPLGMKFVRLPAATFYLGGGGGKAGKPTKIEKDFEIACHLVTQSQWQELMKNNPSSISREGRGKKLVANVNDEDLKQFPVEAVSWNDTQKFFAELNKQEQGKGWLYRLPDSAEWEYACRGGATSELECSYHYYVDKPSNDLSVAQANIKGDGAQGRTTRVDQYLPNKLGLYDMHGNVYQWCNDREPIAPSSYIYRGGTWLFDKSHSTAAPPDPLYDSPDFRGDGWLGFRVARSVVKQGEAIGAESGRP